MRQHHDARPYVPAPRLCFLAVGLLLGFCAWVGQACAQGDGIDPVEDLQAALQAIRLEELTTPTDAVLNFRKETLQKKIARLKKVGDLRRALALEDWKTPIDNAARKEVADKIVERVQFVIDKGSPLARSAMAQLIAEIGPSIRSANPDDPKEGKAGFARTLTKQVVQLCKDPDVEVQQEALRALGNINARPSDAYPVFKEALEHGQVGAKRQAAAALSQMIRVVHFLQKRGRSVATNIESSRPEVIEVAEAAAAAASFGLSDADAQVRRLCLEAVDEAAKVATDMIREPESRKTFPPEGRPLSDDERKLIQNFQAALVADGKEIERLFLTFQKEAALIARDLRLNEPAIAGEALKALENIATARLRMVRLGLSVPTLSKAEEVQRRKQIATMDPMAYFFEDDHLDSITAQLRSPDASVRRTALEVLELLGEDAQRALPAIAGNLTDPDRFNRWAAARAIGNIGPRKALDAIPGLAAQLGDVDPNVRLQASATLEAMGPDAQGALPALIKAISEGDAEPRVAAMNVLLSIGPKYDRPAVPALIGCLGSTDPRVRRAAADVLGKLGPMAEDAIPALRRASEDDDQDVRINASEAILAILMSPHD